MTVTLQHQSLRAESAPLRVGGREGHAVCRLLDEDPSLGEWLRPEVRARAALECRARVVRLGRGRWDGRALAPGPGGIGLLVLDGLLIRRVQMGGRSGGELLGEGDLLCSPVSGGFPALDVAADWRVLRPTRLAVLDAPVAYRLARYPELTGQLVDRALERAHRLAVNMAIVHQARIEARLELLFSRLAMRWGRVRCDGVYLPLRLTHSLLADLVAAQRPSVTSALQRLAEQGRVRALADGWLLASECAALRPADEMLAKLAPAGAPSAMSGWASAPSATLAAAAGRSATPDQASETPGALAGRSPGPES